MRLVLGIEYDGSDFCGWQRQSGGRTVQACVEQALSRVADHEVNVVCAGRTDTGVHATGQVIHFDTLAVRNPNSWVRGANSNLPADIRVHWLTETDEIFHARFTATKRQYRYIIHNSPVRSALLRKRVCWEFYPLDDTRMTEAAKYLLGTHDYTSFRAVACQAQSPVRTVSCLEINRRGDFIYIDIEANAFLQHMVRCIAGVLIAVGRGEQLPQWVNDVLMARDRCLSGMNAAPAGLYLARVHYPPEFEVTSANWLPVYD